ncbi:Arc family DNA-binding protein [Rhizobium leguminosarum]|uniref:Arc family DNA-binding protein n=1 Tax=Rhizobium leguminosarum TaxID=384 RepID=UPI001C95DB3C|nr:Arc family DNA-binding protein [Rhizobium leguminosarum]MBY5798429.1 Arc family DNA-binding protein [Rhizobium leguminosarum]
MGDHEGVRITLRLPEGLRDQVRASSVETGRSLNAEIVARLEATFGSLENEDPQLEILHGYLEQAQKERGELVDALDNFERYLRGLADAHRTLAIMARTVGKVFLTDGVSSEVLKIMAAGLSQINIDVYPDPPKRRP